VVPAGEEEVKAIAMPTSRQTMQVVILAGGLATRLGELTRNRPKSLLRIQGKPFLEYQLEFLKRGGVNEVVLCTGHMGEQIKSCFGNGNRYGLSIEYSQEDRLLGTAGALKNAEALLNEEFFTLYGDSYLFLDLSAIMRYFKSRGKLALMTVYKNHDRYDRSNTAIEGDLVSRYSKNGGAGDTAYIDYGLNILAKRALDMVPRARFYPLEDLFSRLVAKKELLAYEVNERFYEIGSPAGLREFEEYMGPIR